MSNYTVATIISEEERLRMLRITEGEPEIAHQDYNLFHLEKWYVQNNERCQSIDDCTDRPAVGNQYILRYSEGSFTRMHSDDDAKVGQTIVTLLHEDSLVGGETLIMNEYEKRPRKRGHYAKRSGKGAEPYGRHIIPTIVDLKVGESVIYKHNVSHGVCQVKKGERIVLVSWYGDYKS